MKITILYFIVSPFCHTVEVQFYKEKFILIIKTKTIEKERSNELKC